MKNAKIIMGILVIFALGAVVGSLSARMFYESRIEALVSGDSQVREEALINQLSKRLDLDGRQREQMRLIIHNTRQEIHRQIHPLIMAEKEKSKAEVRKILKPEQIVKYEKMIAETKER
ncbi:MAG: hypothetical protein PHN75_03740 [Syntrophales bacterium]|nr:hypothetical protein [Syntrophales bacterium]